MDPPRAGVVLAETARCAGDQAGGRYTTLWGSTGDDIWEAKARPFYSRQHWLSTAGPRKQNVSSFPPFRNVCRSETGASVIRYPRDAALVGAPPLEHVSQSFPVIAAYAFTSDSVPDW